MSEISKTISDTAYQAYEKKLIKDIKNGHDIPTHVAVIMDGNRRFARQLGLEKESGHVKGKEKLEDMLEWCTDIGIKILTVYAFSTENFKRDSKEVQHLMNLFNREFKRAADDDRIHENEIRINAIGNIEKLPREVKDSIKYAEKKTKDYDNYFFNVAVGYGGREEIIQGIQKIAIDVKEGKLDVEDIDEKVFADRLYTSNFPDPDLILRTSGEERISNFLLWQSAYSELYFTDVYWPGFRKIDFLRAIRSYQNRHRRKGE
ncbi:MAG: polyprenyl diphosphate synthase [Candidatus Natronoplasma sp.]